MSVSPTRGSFTALGETLRKLRPSLETRTLAISFAVGVLVGGVAVAFYYVLHHLTDLLLLQWAGYDPFAIPAEGAMRPWVPEIGSRWILFVLPALGGLVSGILVYTWAPESEGHGTDGTLKAFHQDQGVIRARVPLIKSLSSAATLASGGSAGLEGPFAMIGAGVGSNIADRLGLSTRERRIFLISGLAAGLGAIFRAPLGAAITAVEVPYREDFETDALVPAIVASVTSFTIFASVYGFEHKLEMPDRAFHDPRQLPIYLLLGILCVPLGMLYVKVFYGSRDYFFRKIPLPQHVIPMIGGVMLGGIGLICPYVYGTGWGLVQEVVWNNIPIAMLLALIFLKILATSVTVGSGGSGGVFGPSLVIGGLIGGIVGAVAHRYAPGVVEHPETFALVGMAGFFAGVANAPIASILMVCEITGSYELLAPLLLVSAVAILAMKHVSIYENQVEDRFHSPAHLGDLTVDLLKEVSVRAALPRHRTVRTVPMSMHFGELQEAISRSDHAVFPVVDGDGALRGLVSISEVRAVLFEEGLSDLVVAGEIMGRLVTLSPDDNLHDALIQFLTSGYDELPVVDRNQEDQIIGTLRHKDVIAAYQNELTYRLQDS